MQAATRPRANLVFLIDTSGSMDAPNRLPLVKQSLAMLVDAARSRTTRGDRHLRRPCRHRARADRRVRQERRFSGVIERLDAGGTTAGAEGIRQAYALAEQNFDPDGVNRVILATDGDFNVGITDQDELKGFVERQRGKGIFLSVLGFGMGNYNDALMQALAQNGNGVAAYIDTLNEARKVLVEEATSTLIPIAKDVKIQVEFNPATVAEYRLIGYETRLLKREDFNNDKVDAGDVGSGQTVTALYEIVPVGGPRVVGDLRYGELGSGGHAAPASAAAEYAFVKIRYKLPKSDVSTLISTPIDRGAEHARFEEAPRRGPLCDRRRRVRRDSARRPLYRRVRLRRRAAHRVGGARRRPVRLPDRVPAARPRRQDRERYASAPLVRSAPRPARRFPPTPCRMATAPQFHCGAVRRLNSGLRSAANLDLICDLVTRPPAH